MKTSHQSSLKLTVRRLAVAAVTFGLLWAAAPASAQLVRIGASVGALEPGGFMRGTDTAYDPVHGVYLLVTGNGPIFGVFVNSLGLPVSAAFLIMDGSGWGHFPRAEYSPDVFGGQGGFLVTWHHNIGVNCVFGRLVSVSAGGVASGIVQISDGTQGGSWWETGAAMAYSRTSRRFLVAWRTAQYGILGRLIDFNGGLASTIIPLENAFGSRDPSLAWNPATDEFGLASTGFGASAFAAFRRVRASDGAVSARTTFGFGAGTFATAIDVNAWTNQYVMAWSLHPGTMTATFDPFGNQVATNFVTGRLGHDQSLGLAYNASSGTFLAVGSDHYSAEIAAVEVKGGGAPNSVADIITNGASARGGSYYPLTTAQAGTNQWDVVYSRDFRGATSQIIATTSTGGGSPTPTLAPTPTAAPTPTPTAGCATPDPFVSIGGGTCVNGGWQPGGNTAPTPTATPTPTPTPTPGCAMPDPFVSIGGGTCVNGGWLPGTSTPTTTPTPTPTPTPSPTPAPAPTCTTPDPFVSIGGGTCISNGWVPGVVTLIPTPTPTPTPNPSSCTTPDPFVSLGGGVCISGGWTPR